MGNSAVLLYLNWENLKASDAFCDALSGFDLIDWEDVPRASTDLSAVKYAVVWKPEPGLLARCPKLEVIFSVGAGVDHIFIDPHLPDLPIVRFVDPHLTEPMVEWVLLQVLLHLRQQRSYDANQREHRWHEFPQPLARDFRVGIMGFGELGQACAKALSTLRFQINGWSRTEKKIKDVTCYHGDDQLDVFLATTDILVCLLPLTEETRGIINADLISKLATDGPFRAPVVINGGRGGSQVESDIAAALQVGNLRGASLDVFETEPLPGNSPLWNFDNLVITPHAAAVSHPSALADHVARQIRRYENGNALEFLVDRSRGY